MTFTDYSAIVGSGLEVGEMNQVEEVYTRAQLKEQIGNFESTAIEATTCLAVANIVKKIFSNNVGLYRDPHNFNIFLLANSLYLKAKNSTAGDVIILNGDFKRSDYISFLIFIQENHCIGEKNFFQIIKLFIYQFLNSKKFYCDNPKEMSLAPT